MDWVVVFCGVEDGVTSTDLINSQLVVNTQTQLEVKIWKVPRSGEKPGLVFSLFHLASFWVGSFYAGLVGFSAEARFTRTF